MQKHELENMQIRTNVIRALSACVDMGGLIVFGQIVTMDVRI